MLSESETELCTTLMAFELEDSVACGLSLVISLLLEACGQACGLRSDCGLLEIGLGFTPSQTAHGHVTFPEAAITETLVTNNFTVLIYGTLLKVTALDKSVLAVAEWAGLVQLIT